MRHTKFSESEDHKLIECVKAHPELYNLQHGNNKNLYVKDKIWNSISTEVARDVDSCKKRWKDMKDHYFKLKRKQKLEAAASLPVKKTSWLLFERLSFLSENSCRENETVGAVQFECVIKQENSLSEDEVEKNSCGSFTSDSFYGFNNDVESPVADPSPSTQNNHNSNGSCSRFVAKTQQQEQQQTKKRKELEAIEENTQRTLQLLETVVSKKAKIGPEDNKNNNDDDDVDMFLKSVAVTLKKLPPLLIAQAKMSILSTVSMLQFSAQSFRPETISAAENLKLSASSSLAGENIKSPETNNSLNSRN